MKSKTFAVVKLHSGKTLCTRVHERATWLYPFIAMMITGIIVFVLLSLIK